jgi:hypothetical protein
MGRGSVPSSKCVFVCFRPQWAAVRFPARSAFLNLFGPKWGRGSVRNVPLAKPTATGPEPKMWAASPDEITPWGPNQAVRSIPMGHGTEELPPSWSLHRVMTSLLSPRVQVTPSRVLHGSEPWALTGGAARPPRAPPGRSESQLEPPDSWPRQRGSRLSAKLFRLKTLLAKSVIWQRGQHY